MSQEILNVEGMSCGHCKSAVESALIILTVSLQLTLTLKMVK